MVFSFFRRKSKRERHRDQSVERDAVSTHADPALQADTLAERRREARLTEEKIDRIESEMIASAARAVPQRPESPAPPASEPRRTTVVATLPPTQWFPGSSDADRGGRSSAMAIDINASSLPGVLEEAAIRFASGQAADAAETLRHALSDADLGGFLQLAWLMLLDLYQFTGERAGFESLALEYATRFESSPPNWSEGPGSTAEVERLTAAAVVALPVHVGDSIASRIELVARGMNRGRETVLDFTPVQTVDASGAALLLTLLRRFENAPSRYALVARNPRRLFDATCAAVEPGRRDESDACWTLALFCLRLLGEAQRFEDLAIEYCVTYEVSPPSWEPLPKSIRVVDRPAHDPGEPLEAPTTILPPAEPNAFVLSGEIGGRMQEEVKALRAFSIGRADVVIDCRALRRIEFAAAGELLNEIVTLRTAGKQVLVVEPSRLVYALMLVMGIQELAEIRQRRI